MGKDDIEVPLTRGKFAIVSAIDAERVCRHKWCATPARSGLWYAVRGIIRNGKQTTESMHRFILGITDGQVDHKDGDGLNNRRENIWKVSVNVNNHRSNSGFRGVSKHSYAGYAAYIIVNNKTRYLGLFNDAETAARHYDKAAREVHGVAAMVNFP